MDPRKIIISLLIFINSRTVYQQQSKKRGIPAYSALAKAQLEKGAEVWAPWVSRGNWQKLELSIWASSLWGLWTTPPEARLKECWQSSKHWFSPSPLLTGQPVSAPRLNSEVCPVAGHTQRGRGVWSECQRAVVLTLAPPLTMVQSWTSSLTPLGLSSLTYQVRSWDWDLYRVFELKTERILCPLMTQSHRLDTKARSFSSLWILTGTQPETSVSPKSGLSKHFPWGMNATILRALESPTTKKPVYSLRWTSLSLP